MNIRFIGGVIAVALIGGGYLLMDRTFEAHKLPDHAPEMVDAQLQSGSVEAFRIVKTAFPEGYAGLVEELSAALKRGAGQPEISAISRRVMTSLRRTHADAILSAPDPRVREVLRMSRDIHQAVRDQEGRAVCNRFAIDGVPALGDALQEYVTSVVDQDTALLQALADGHLDGSTPLVPVTAQDWDVARARARADGVAPAHLDALRDLERETGDICAGLIGLLDALLAMADEQGRRLRASYVRDLARN